jgi:ATP-binding protein involved in chromosome partitioning
MMHQRVVGVVENMSYLACPHCSDQGKEHRLEVFGSGGGARVAQTLTQRFGYDVPLLGEVALDTRLRAGGDSGRPIVSADPAAPAAVELSAIAERLGGRTRNLAGMQLGLTPAGKF